MAGCGVKAKGGGTPKTGLSPGSIFLIMYVYSLKVILRFYHSNRYSRFFVGFFVYFLAGFIVNWQVRKVGSGVDALPNVEFWKGLPGLMVVWFFFLRSLLCLAGFVNNALFFKDGVVFTKNKILGLMGKGYNQL